MRITRHVEAEDRRADVRARREVEILAALVKCSVVYIAQAVGDLRALAFFERIDERRFVP